MFVFFWVLAAALALVALALGLALLALRWREQDGGLTSIRIEVAITRGEPIWAVTVDGPGDAARKVYRIGPRRRRL